MDNRIFNLPGKPEDYAYISYNPVDPEAARKGNPTALETLGKCYRWMRKKKNARALAFECFWYAARISKKDLELRCCLTEYLGIKEEQELAKVSGWLMNAKKLAHPNDELFLSVIHKLKKLGVKIPA